MMSVTNEECHKYALIAECRYAECRYIECRNTEFHVSNIKLHGRKRFGENFKILRLSVVTPRNPYRTGKFSTIDLHALTCLEQLLLILQT
jgi:hypothetical protein